MEITRRKLLGGGTLAAAGLMVFGQKLTWPLTVMADANDIDADDIKRQIAAISAGSDAAFVQQQIINLITDPAIAALATSTLQTGGNTLTGFQQSLLQSILIMTRDPASLGALASGAQLTDGQRQSINSIKKDLRNNPAIQLVIDTAQNAAKNGQLPGFVGQTIANSRINLPFPTPLGSAALDAVARDIFNAKGSVAAANLTAALTPIIQSPNFISFLKTQQPEVVAGFIPPNILINLLLPTDIDPGILDIVKAGLEILGGIAGLIAAILLAPEELTAAVIVGLTLAVFAALTAIAVGFIDLFQAIDCDFDGDPSDPNDVPGIECAPVG